MYFNNILTVIKNNIIQRKYVNLAIFKIAVGGIRGLQFKSYTIPYITITTALCSAPKVIIS